MVQNPVSSNDVRQHLPTDISNHFKIIVVFTHVLHLKLASLQAAMLGILSPEENQ